jgi:hypothetical protein
MKRFLAAFGAFVGGLLLTWLCVYTLSHASLPSLGWKRAGCDVEHCGPAWIVPATLALILVPSVSFAVAGWRAVARAWPIRRAVAVFGLLVVGTAVMFTTAYVL